MVCSFVVNNRFTTSLAPKVNTTIYENGVDRNRGASLKRCRQHCRLGNGTNAHMWDYPTPFNFI